MSGLVKIGDVELAPVEYRGARVMTLSMMDDVHKRSDGTARRNFNEHKARLVDGEDFYKVSASEIRTHKICAISSKAHEDVILLTETGYSMLVKSFTDDLAWEVQRQLVKSYFGKQAVADPLAALPPEQRALVQLMCENAEIKARQAQIEVKQAEQGESIKRIEAKQSAFENGHSFFTAIGFCALRDIKLSLRDMQKLGRRAGAISRKRRIPIDKVRDARYGMVNSYHEETLAQALNEIHGGM
jgi:ORF6N domain